MAAPGGDDPFEEEFGISIEEMGFDPREIRSQEAFDALTDEQRNLFANIRYESSLAPEERKKIADKRRKKKEEEGKKKEAEKATVERREIEETKLLVPDCKNVFIPIWEGFDQLCFSTMYDVFKAAGFNILVGVVQPPRIVPPTEDLQNERRPQVRSNSGMFVSGDFLFEFRGNHNFNQFDAIVIPSGENIRTTLLHNRKLCSLVKGLAWRKKFICGVEDVPGLLFLRIGVLSKLKCTGSERSEEEITNPVPEELGNEITFRKEDPVVVDGFVITARQQCDSQECALTILGNLCGAKVMEQIARKLGYGDFVERVRKNTTEPAKPKPKGKKGAGVKTTGPAKKDAAAAAAKEEKEEKKVDEEEEEDELS